MANSRSPSATHNLSSPPNIANSPEPTTSRPQVIEENAKIITNIPHIWFQNQRQKTRRPRSQSDTPSARPTQYGPFPSTPDSISSLPTCGLLPQPVADGRMSAPIEVSSAHSAANITPQPHGVIPNQSTTTDTGQDPRSALPPQRPLPQPLPRTPDSIPGRHTERAWNPVNQNVAQPIMNESLEEKSECNTPTNSLHADRTQSTPDLDELGSKGKEKAIPQDQTEDMAGLKDTSASIQTQSFEELLELLRELRREKNIHRHLHSSSQYGAGSFGQPHTNPTLDASRSSDSAQHLLPEYKVPSAYVTKVSHHYHYHYHYDTPNVSSPPIINKKYPQNQQSKHFQWF